MKPYEYVIFVATQLPGQPVGKWYRSGAEKDEIRCAEHIARVRKSIEPGTGKLHFKVFKAETEWTEVTAKFDN